MQVERPVATTQELQLVNVNPNSGYVSVLTAESELRADLRIDEETLLAEVRLMNLVFGLSFDLGLLG